MQSVIDVGLGTKPKHKTESKTFAKPMRRFGEVIASLFFSLIGIAFLRLINRKHQQ